MGESPGARTRVASPAELQEAQPDVHQHRLMPVVGQPHADDVSAVIDVVKTGGLFDHPMFDASQDARFGGLGRLRGVRPCDAERGTEQRVVPPPGDQAWLRPVAAMVGGQLTVYAAPQDRQDGRVAWRENARRVTG